MERPCSPNLYVNDPLISNQPIESHSPQILDTHNQASGQPQFAEVPEDILPILPSALRAQSRQLVHIPDEIELHDLEMQRQRLERQEALNVKQHRNAIAHREGRMTGEEFQEAELERRIKWLAGDNPTPEQLQNAREMASGAYAKGGKYEPITVPAALKRGLQKRGGEKITEVELPDGSFMSARRLRKSRNSTTLLDIDPRAIYYTKDGYKGYVGELARAPENDAKRPKLTARMQQMDALRSIYRQEGHLWQRREQGEIAELSAIPARYKRDLQSLCGDYTKKREASVHAFNESSLPPYQRGQLVDDLQIIITSRGDSIHATIDRHANIVQARVHSMNQIAEGALDEHEKRAVEEARRYIDTIAEKIENKGHGWHGQRKYHWEGRAIEERIDSILSNDEHAPERNTLVRVALNEHLLNIAERLAQEGDFQQAREMLSYFHKTGVIHKHARQAMDIIIDRVYTDALVAGQKRRIIPGVSHYSYLTQSGSPGENNRLTQIVGIERAFSNKDVYAAAEIVVDAVVVRQMEAVRIHQNDPGRAMDYTVNNMCFVVSSMNDRRAAAVYRAFFEAPPADRAGKVLFFPNEHTEGVPIRPGQITSSSSPSAQKRRGIRKIF